MKIERIALHKFNLCAKGIISTIRLPEGEYETMVLIDEKEEDCLRADSVERARDNHTAMVNKWNDIMYRRQLHLFGSKYADIKFWLTEQNDEE